MIAFESISSSELAASSWLPPTTGTAPKVLGIDIGGANLKFAFRRQTASCPFPMWLESHLLGKRIQDALASLRDIPDAIALTMTGELADCFPTRRSGVQHILVQVAEAFPVERTFVYGVAGQWFSTQQATAQPWEVAASNWHVLARFVGRLGTKAAAGVDVVVDVGSTTVDIIPVRNGQVATPARTDRQRMQLGQLVYTGYERTPITAITHQVTVEGQPCPIMAERFADSLDAYLVLGHAAEEPSNCETADRKARTRTCAAARLARIVGEDLESLPFCEIESLAMQIIEIQAQGIARAIKQNVPRSANGDRGRPNVVFCGHGMHLIGQVEHSLGAQFAEYCKLQDIVGGTASRNASALAVASQYEQDFTSGAAI